MSESTENMSKAEEDTTAEKKMSHKKWRALIKKQKRKVKRQAEAKRLEAEQELEELSSTRQATKEYEERQQQLKEQYEDKLRYALQQKWLEREYFAQQAFKQKQIREKNEKERLVEQERRIREEWEEQQKKEQKERDEEEKKKQRQEELLKEATKNEKKGDGDSWHNPLAPRLVPGIERENCPFFIKVGACRFGDRCSRGHPYPETSSTIMLPGMYTHYKLEHSMKDEYDTDLGLEYEDSETYSHFKEFYYDTLPEFEKFGRVIQYKACANFEQHLRGNVYVQYDKEEDAMQACAAFHGRYYGGRQLNCHLSGVETWKQAICGLYYSNKCPKGRTCNFLHAFPNPGNAFKFVQRHDANRLERLMHSRTPAYRYSRSRSRSRSPRRRRRRRRSRSYNRSRRRSRSYGRSRRSRTRSRSSKRFRSRRSKSRSRTRSKSPHRKCRNTKSRSPCPQRYHSRSPEDRSPTRYRSSKYRGRSVSRNRSESRSLSRSPDYQRRRSPSPKDFKLRSPSSSSHKKTVKSKKSKKRSKEKYGNKIKQTKDNGKKDASSSTRSNGHHKSGYQSPAESGSETSNSRYSKTASVKDLLNIVPGTEVTDASIMGDNMDNKDKALEFLDSVLANIGSS